MSLTRLSRLQVARGDELHCMVIIFGAKQTQVANPFGRADELASCCCFRRCRLKHDCGRNKTQLSGPEELSRAGFWAFERRKWNGGRSGEHKGARG